MVEEAISTDPRVRNLVDVLNSLPGVYTFSSCGGHEDNGHSGRCPADEFYVNIELDGAPGLHSLGIIAFAAAEVDFENIAVVVWSNTDEAEHAGEAVGFEIYGIDGVDPDALAAAIAAHLP